MGGRQSKNDNIRENLFNLIPNKVVLEIIQYIEGVNVLYYPIRQRLEDLKSLSICCKRFCNLVHIYHITEYHIAFDNYDDYYIMTSQLLKAIPYNEKMEVTRIIHKRSINKKRKRNRS